MKKIFLLLTIININTFVYGQFNTISKDSSPVVLIGEPSVEREKVGEASAREEVVGGLESGVSDTIGISEVKYYEMPGGSSGKERVGDGLSDDEEGPGVFGRLTRSVKKALGMKVLTSEEKARKKMMKRKRKAPQVIVIPLQGYGMQPSSVVRDVEKIDEYTDDRLEDLSYRELSSEDIRRLDLLSQRSTVSMPLRRFRLTSKFGYRRDPLGQGTRFHDGVDLSCSYEPVFAMLPGVVTKVQHGTTGYGNYVVLNHGNIECLYGHLSDIGVEEGEAVQAGDVVAISGNTGRSTGPHLHVKMTYMGQRVDPLVFIDYINDYIHQLQSQLYGGEADEEYLDGGALSIENLIVAMEHYGLHHQSVVLAQALLETGYFTSSVCRNKNNLFGLTRRDGQYYEFATWQESVKGYRDMIQYRYKGGDYYEFLRRVPYAEDPYYINKVKHIESQLGGYGFLLGEGGE